MNKANTADYTFSSGRLDMQLAIRTFGGPQEWAFLELLTVLVIQGIWPYSRAFRDNCFSYSTNDAGLCWLCGQLVSANHATHSHYEPAKDRFWDNGECRWITRDECQQKSMDRFRRLGKEMARRRNEEFWRRFIG